VAELVPLTPLQNFILEDVRLEIPVVSGGNVGGNLYLQYAINCSIKRNKFTGSGGDAAIGFDTVAQSIVTENYIADISHVGLTGSSNGDAFQTIVSSDQWLGKLYLADIYVYKAAPVKQAVLLSDGTGGITMERFHFKGEEKAHVQVGLETCKGLINIRNGYIEGGCVDNAAFRFVTSSGVALATGAVLNISNVLVRARIHSGFFTAGSVAVAATTDGTVSITNCAIEGENVQRFTFSGDFSFHPSTVLTINANTKFNLRNNIVNSRGAYAVSLPPEATVTGSPNNWVVKNNAFTPNATFFFASGSSQTLAQFVATHTAATNNVDPSLFNLNPDYSPKTTSGLYRTGLLTTLTLDQSNSQRYNPPSMGPKEAPPTRSVR